MSDADRERWNSEYASGRWDFLSSPMEHPRLSLVAGLLRCPEDADLLDLGSGPGHLLDWLPEIRAPHYVAVDIADEADLVGIDHVGLGIDYYQGQYPVEDDPKAMARYEQLVSEGLWRRSEYPPPPYKYPEGIETPRTLSCLTEGLIGRGFAEDEIRKVLALNWMRVSRAVWG